MPACPLVAPAQTVAYDIYPSMRWGAVLGEWGMALCLAGVPHAMPRTAQLAARISERSDPACRQACL